MRSKVFSNLRPYLYTTAAVLSSAYVIQYKQQKPQASVSVDDPISVSRSEPESRSKALPASTRSNKQVNSISRMGSLPPAQPSAANPDPDTLRPFELTFAVQMSCESCVASLRDALSSVPGNYNYLFTFLHWASSI
jgi:hypothetical protein